MTIALASTWRPEATDRLAQADGLRKSLSKKRPGRHLASYAAEFFAGAAALGRSEETTKEVWHMVLSFSGYSFCKGHSCSYIQVAQHSCFLRAHYPAEFMAAVLANGGGFYHPFAYVAEARRMGLEVLPPDVNASAVRTTGRARALRIGLQCVKGLGEAAMERVVTVRTAGGPYRSLADLAARPFVMEPVGTTARDWTTTVCRQAGFEPDVRYTSTDLQIHLRLVERGHAAALLPDLAGARSRPDVVVRRLPDHPERQIFATVRRGATGQPKIQAFTTALRSQDG